MRDEDKQRLYQIVLDKLERHRGKNSRRRVQDAIFAAHNGRPDGCLVTADNMWLFRQYRNSVSPNPKHMVDAALAYGKEVKNV